MDKFWFKVNHRYFIKLLIGISLVTVFVSVILFWRSYQITQSAVINQIQQQQLILAKAGARGIKEYFNSKIVALLLIAGSPESLENDMSSVMNKQRMKDEGIVNFVRINKEGIATKVIDIKDITMGEGVDVSDREYFQFAKNPTNQGKVFVSKPIIVRGGSYEDKPLILLATGVFDINSTFDGVVLFSILPEHLADQFIFPLKIHPQSRTFIIDNDSEMIFGRYPTLIGEKLLEYAQSKQWYKSDTYINALTEITKGGEGNTQWYFAAPDSTEALQKLIAYAPIRFNGDRYWSLIISTPYEVISSPLKTFTFQQSLALILSLFVLIILLILFDLGIHVALKDGYEKAIKDMGSDLIKKIKK